MEGDPKTSICFLCLNLTSCHGDEKTENGTFQISQKFLRFTENQLELPLKDFFLDDEQLGNGFCRECDNVVCMICSLYDDLCSVQAKLKEKVDQLLDLLERSSKKKYNGSGEDTEIGMRTRSKGHYKKVVEKRIQLKQHCKRYCQATEKSVNTSQDLSGNKVDDNRLDIQVDDDEERLDGESELGSLIGDEDEDYIRLQEMEAGPEAIENGSDASSLQNAESPGSPAATEENDDKEDVSNNSDSDWKEESEVENDDGTSSNPSETDNDDDDSLSEFEVNNSTSKTKEPPKTQKIDKSVRSPRKVANLNEDDLGDSIYKCEKCGKPYISKGYLDRHLRKEHGHINSRHKTCDICGKEFSQYSSLMRHKEAKHNGRPEIEKTVSHTCNKCGHIFWRKGFLDKHMIKVHGIGSMKSFIYSCKLCGKRFNIKGNFTRHQRESHKIIRTKTEALRDHKMRAHEEINRPSPSPSTTPPDILIGDEDNEKEIKQEMDAVTEAIENESDASNDQNAKYPGSPEDEKEDFRTNNSDSVWKGKSEPETAEGNSSNNTETDKDDDGSNDDFYAKNTNKCLGDAIYKCEKCGKPYITKGYLDRHLRKEHGLGKSSHLTCDLCGKEFSQYSTLMRHKESKHNGSPAIENTVSHTCNKCNHSFQKKGCLDKHMIKAHGTMKSFIYNCNLCEKGFNIKGSFTRHQREAHKITPTKTEAQFFCETCPNSFKTIKSLRDHKQRAHKKITRPSSSTPPPDKPYKCEICNYASTNHYGLVLHANRKHGIDRKLVSKPVNCTICLETCKDNYSLERHVNLVHQSKMEVSCPQCPMKFDTRRQLIHHKYDVHKKDDITVSFMKRLESAKGNINDEVKINCVVCKEEFSSWEVLRSHLRIHEDEIQLGEKILMCFKCDKLFAYEQTIWAHLRSSKRHDYTSIEFPCDHGNHLGYSQWVYQSPSLLENHFKEEHQDCGVLKCEQCGWPFLDKNMLDIHRLLHVPRINQKYQCPVCSNTFLNQDSLQGHYNPVHGVSLKLFRCQVCKWGFATKRGLAGHAKTHETTECLEFLCSKCPRSFKTAIQLRDHIRHIHVSKQCSECGIFVQRSRLSHHRKMKHGEKGHLCTQCGMAFRDNASLKNHMAFHGEYHYKCEYCGKGCVSGWYLKKHIRKVHKDKVGNEGVK